MTKQPKAVWAVAFACVVAFMGIGLVDPVLVALAILLVGRRHLAAAEIESVPGQLCIRPLRTAGART